MKKLLRISFVAALLLAIGIPDANAQMPAPYGTEGSRSGMGRFQSVDWTEVVEHTEREEIEGQTLWQKLGAKETQCPILSDEDFERLGEYFMGQMMGDAHPAMNAMMIRMLGEEGEEQMHVVMGKRLSGCDTTATYPLSGRGFMPMMQMMWPSFAKATEGKGGWSGPLGFNQGMWPMMWNYGTGPGSWMFLGAGWLFMIFWWLLVIAGIVLLVRWLIRQAKGGTGLWGKSALDILKERYAKGEITKHEYEEMSREIKNQ